MANLTAEICGNQNIRGGLAKKIPYQNSTEMQPRNNTFKIEIRLRLKKGNKPFKSCSLTEVLCARLIAFLALFSSLGSRLVTGCLLSGGGFTHVQPFVSCQHAQINISKERMTRGTDARRKILLIRLPK